FIIGGLIFILVEQKNKRSEQHPQASHNQKTSDLNNITLTQALIIGLGQTLALIPGTSRSGATIISGMLSKLDRKTSTEFSFLAAIPVIAATTLYSAIKYSDQLTQIPTLAIVLGFIVSFTTAY
ncbi:MAG: undecaprenyl-diphosphatase, partial [Phototrophicales bacterium]